MPQRQTRTRTTSAKPSAGTAKKSPAKRGKKRPATVQRVQLSDASQQLLAQWQGYLHVNPQQPSSAPTAYRSAIRDYILWAQIHQIDPQRLSTAAAVLDYVRTPPPQQVKRATLSIRRSAIRAAFLGAGHTDPFADEQVRAAWARYAHTASPVGTTKPLTPPLLWELVELLPSPAPGANSPTRTELAGLRDKAMLLVSFAGALRASELIDLDVNHVHPHENGLVLSIGHAASTQRGVELVALPRFANALHCPVTALEQWLQATGISEGPLWRGMLTATGVREKRMHVNTWTYIMQRLLERAAKNDPRIKPRAYSPHSLRMGFEVYARTHGATARQIAHQTRNHALHKFPADTADSIWDDNAVIRLVSAS